MKLLYVSPAYAPAWTFGGVVASSHRMYEAIASQGEDVTVYTTDAGLSSNDEGARTGFRLMNGVKVHYFKCDWRNPIFSRALIRKTRDTIREFDLLHLAAIWQPLSLGVRRAAVEAQCPYVLKTHGSLDEWSRKFKRLKKSLFYLLVERKNIDLASGIAFNSPMEFAASSRIARRGQELCTISNGLDFTRWARNVEGGKEWRAKLRLASDTYLYLSVGRLHLVKGLELAVRALVPLRGKNWHWAIVGDDADGTKAKLARQTRALGLADQISFHPATPPHQLPALYSAGDLFVLPSLHENFSNVVLEALSCECPVLMSDQVGVYGYLSGIKGVVVRKRDLSMWSQALKSALDGKEEFETSEDDRDDLEQRFAIKNCASRMIEFNNRVLALSRQ